MSASWDQKIGRTEGSMRNPNGNQKHNLDRGQLGHFPLRFGSAGNSVRDANAGREMEGS